MDNNDKQESDNILSDNLYHWPTEAIVCMLEFLSARALLNFGQTCKKFHILSMDNILWRFLVKRDWSDQYKIYAESIILRNIESNNAAISIASINEHFVKIKAISEDIINNVKLLLDVPHLGDQDKIKIEMVGDTMNENSEINDLQVCLLGSFQKKILSEPLFDLLETNPVALYNKFLVDSKKLISLNCIYVYCRGPHKGKVCGNPSIPDSTFCEKCIKKKQTIMNMGSEFIPNYGRKDSLSPEHWNSLIPSLSYSHHIRQNAVNPFNSQRPLRFTNQPPPVRKVEPKRLQIRQLGENCYVTVDETNLVIKYKNPGEYELIGVLVGNEIKEADEEHKKVARGYGFSVN
jgi:hypothetical protein